MPDTVMIFAAGHGTRMGALTAARPKPLIEVAGMPLIDHALDIAFSAGIDTIVANLHAFPDQLAAHLAPRGVRLSHEPKLLETGGGLRAARPLLGAGPIFTLNADAVWRGPNPLATLSAAWDPDRMDALLLLVPVDRATGHDRHGDFTRGPDGRLARGPGHVSPGAQILRLGGLDDIEDEVVPGLGDADGCVRWLREISRKDGFIPEATWLLCRQKLISGESEPCGTIQGIRDRHGFGAVQNLGIIPECRGMGLGEILLRQALHGFGQVGSRQIGTR